MKLQVGERLPGSGPSQQPGGYVVTGVVSETPWYGLYTGRKILYNFDFSGKRVRETEDKEWLDVYLRTIRYPQLDDAEYVSQRRELARAEVRFVLGNRASNLWPEPIDVLEIANTRDPFMFSQAGQELEPIVVFARPHGQLLGDWQQNVLPLASILSVLAELLLFLEQAHEEDLLLHGMGPGSFVVDRADRLHFVGTDMVIAEEAILDARQVVPAQASFTEAAWRKLFPAERYPRGFTAPECFRGETGRRSDLYTWGSLTYFLLTGQVPWQIALEQGRSWAHFQDAHFAALEKVLEGVPARYVTNWLEELGLGDARPSLAWPQGIMMVLRRLLSPDPRRRPESVAELRRWLVSPPPASVAALVAIRDGARARIFVDHGNLDAGLELVVRRTLGNPPTGPGDGASIFAGAPTSVLSDDSIPGDQPVFYAAFTRRKEGREVHHAPPTIGALLEPNPANLRQLAESESTQILADDEVPASVRLCFRAADPALVGAALLESHVPQVRGWVLRHVESEPRTPQLEVVLWKALQDPLASMQQQAARLILKAAKPVDEDLVQRLVWTMGGENVDGAIEAAQGVRSLGVSDELLQRVMDRVEGERALVCPVCQEQVASRLRAEHLRNLHGYIDVDGSLLPRAHALGRLWDQVFAGDARAHERLLAVVAEDGPGKSKHRPRSHPYVAALEAALTGHREIAAEGQQDAVARGAPLGHLIQSLRQTSSIAQLVPHLLRARHPVVREVGREVLLPQLGEKLRDAAITPGDIRSALDQACPDPDLLEEKILLCYRLPQVGVDEGKATLCLAQLQEERLVRCADCESWVRVGDLEAHLLAAHRIYQFRGVRRTPQETKVAVLDALCRPHPDVPAWKMVTLLARDRHGAEAERRLVVWVCSHIRKVHRKERGAVLIAVAEAMTAAGFGARMMPVLLSPLRSAAAKWLARCLALEVAALLAPPVDEQIVARLKPLLADRHFSRGSRQRAVIGLLRTTGKESDGAYAILDAYISQTGKLRALDKLRELEQQLGKSAALDRLYAQTEDQVRMACPRCGLQLRRGQMVKHLWERHRLLLDGLRAREPWRVLEDWVVDYRLEKDPTLLRRCRELARQLDGNQGALRLQQMLLRHGVDDAEAREALLEHARKQQATLCPKCFHFVPVNEAPRPQPLVIREDELRGHGYRLEVSERGPTPYLEIETPEETFYRGREPGRLLTRLGALIFLAGPVVLVAFVVAQLVAGSRLSALPLLALSLGPGLLLGCLVYGLWPRPRPAEDRLIDAAWSLLVPDMIESDLSGQASAFLSSLARTSLERGDPQRRYRILHDCLEEAKEIAAEHLPVVAALTRLHAEDLGQLDREGEDPVDFLVEALRDCFTGNKPLAFADQLLADLSGSDRAWPPGRRDRLRVLLVVETFEAGLELNDLQDLSAAYPGLSAALDLKDFDSLLALRFLWSLQDERPWERSGRATTVFEVADSPEGEDLLERRPRLLLAARGFPVYLTSRGLWCKDICLRDKPGQPEIVRSPQGEGYYLVVGRESLWFRNSPDSFLEQLQRWLTYYFVEFQPSLRKFPALRWGVGMKKLASKNAVYCPRCRHRLLPCRGDVGVNMEEEVVATLV